MSEEDLFKLAFDHKYKVEGSSILDGYVMQPFWRWLVEFLPVKHDPKALFHWTAPNTLTLVGLICMVVPASIMLYYSGDLMTPVPSWIYIINAIMIFVYQTMDALDGKQARRTGSSTAFGEVFDHGCDSISTIFCCLAVICISQGGVSWLSFAMCCGSLISFHACHIQAYYVGHVTFGAIDVTELQFAAISVNLLAGLVSPTFFSTAYIAGVFPAWIIPVLCVGGGGAAATASNLWVTWGRGADRAAHAPTPRRKVWGTTFLFFAAATVWFAESKEKMTGWEGTLFLIALGILSSAQSIVLIVAHICSSEVSSISTLYTLPVILGAANAYAGVVSEGVAVRVAVAVAAGLHAQLSASLSLQITRFLGIHPFKCGAPTCQDTRPSRAPSHRD